MREILRSPAFEMTDQMLERFRGNAGRNRLTHALRMQKVVANEPALATALADAVRLKQFARGQKVITQGSADNALYFLLAGNVAVLVNGREVATRSAGDHVGEMALLDPGAPRSATVIATEPTVAAKISEARFSTIAADHADLWRSIATELARRLRQRARFLPQPNAIPVVFVGSSRETLPVANAIARGLRKSRVDVRLWSQGVFGASTFPIEDLEGQLRSADFALLVAGPDDEVSSRGRIARAPRDNIVFETGLFMGAISRHRTFLLTPREVDLKIPSDLLGLGVLKYSPNVRPLAKATAKARRQLLQIVRALGPR